MTLDKETADKRNYPPGPWTDEADRLEWRYGGLPCLIVRNNLGALCGYVAVYNDHPWFREHYDKLDAHVHGGLTYAGRCQGHICHVPQEGDRDTEVWWLGFDCAHADDLVPGTLLIYAGIEKRMSKTLPQWEELQKSLPSFMREATYRDIEYVKREVTMLANQALEAATIKGRIGHVKHKVAEALQEAKWKVRSAIREAKNPSPPPPPALSEEKLFAMKTRLRRRDEE